MNSEKPTNFEQFFKDNYKQFYYFSLHLIEDEEYSRDIVSDAFEFVWENKNKIENWKTYTYSYIRNKCIDYIRHQVVKNKYADYYLKITPEFDDYTGDTYDVRIEILREVIKTLPAQTRLVLQECYINRKKYKEVAEDLGISPNTVKKHIVKALKIIRKEVSENKR